MREYIKDFDSWNILKKTTNSKIPPDGFFFLERELWWASIGVNIGDEIDGKNNNFERPILVLKKFNENSLIALPITSTKKDNGHFIQIRYKGIVATVSVLQIRFMSASRLLRIISRIDEGDFIMVKKKVIDMIS